VTTLTLTPAGRPSSPAKAMAAQLRMELVILVRNGEQLLLTLVIPALLLVMFATTSIADVPKPRVDFLVPGVLALAVMSTAFTGQAIATGFERRYGVLRRLATTPMPTSALLIAKSFAVLAVEVGQVALLAAIAAGLGWSPRGNIGTVAALLLLGTTAFSGLGLLIAGVLRAEATLAVANLVYLVLLVFGGVAFPIADFGRTLRDVVLVLPITALTDGLRAVLLSGADVPARDWLTLACWSVGTGLGAAAFFRTDG
jgi:ABC-2 type transport system permease protein